MSSVRIAASFLQRLRGLLFTKPDAGELLLVKCCDIHTYGMTYALDIAFLDAGMHVLMSQRNVKPGRRVRCPDACMVLERVYDASLDWYEQGMPVEEKVRQAYMKGVEQ